MMKDVKRTDALGRRLKRTFSQEEKQKFCAEWKDSGLSKFRFCKERGLVLSAFSQWCRKFQSHKGKSTSKKGWLALVPKEAASKSRELILFEVKLPNGMVFSTSFELTQLLTLLKDLNNALTIVR